MRKPLLVYLSLAGLLSLPHAGRDVAGRWEVSAPMRDAEASTAVAYTLEELIDVAPSVVVAKAIERESKWEKVGSGKRIVTYTKLEVASRVLGEGAETVWVRTLGGIVGKIGQQVAGEARFELGRTSVVFLARAPRGLTVVAGAAQGHYPAVAEERADAPDEAPTRLRVSPSLGRIVERPGPRITAIQRLVGRSVPDAVATIREAKAELDAHRKNDE